MRPRSKSSQRCQVIIKKQKTNVVYILFVHHYFTPLEWTFYFIQNRMLPTLLIGKPTDFLLAKEKNSLIFVHLLILTGFSNFSADFYWCCKDSNSLIFCQLNSHFYRNLEKMAPKISRKMWNKVIFNVYWFLVIFNPIFQKTTNFSSISIGNTVNIYNFYYLLTHICSISWSQICGGCGRGALVPYLILSHASLSPFIIVYNNRSSSKPLQPPSLHPSSRVPPYKHHQYFYP